MAIRLNDPVTSHLPVQDQLGEKTWP